MCEKKLYVLTFCAFTLWVLCCGVRYDFRIKKHVGSVFTSSCCTRGRMSYLRYLCLFGSSLPPVVVQEGVCLIYVICVCLVRLYLQLLYRRAYVLFTLFVFVWFVFTSSCCTGGLMSCLRYLYLFVYSGVQHILCSVFVLFWSSSCLPYVAVVSLDCPFVIALSVFSNVYIVYIVLLINNTRFLLMGFLDQHCGDVYQ